jgi:Cu2+-containing amine oxidase
MGPASLAHSPLPIPTDHPLDQLTTQEVARASAAVKRYATSVAGLQGTLRFNTIMLQEPPKAAMLAYEAGEGPCPPRQALVWFIHPASSSFFEAAVVLPEVRHAPLMASWH